MRAAFATLALFTLFTCTAAQSPIITTSTSNTLSDDFQDDDLSDISVPENDDLNPAFDDSSQFSAGSETSASGIQSSLSTDDFASQVSPTPAGVSSGTEPAAPTTPESELPAATLPPVPSPTSPPSAKATPAPLAPGITSSPEATASRDAAATTPSPSESAVVEEDDQTEAGVTPTEAAATDPTTTRDDLSATPSPSTDSSTESPGAEATTTSSGATGVWADSWVTVSTVTVGTLGVIALRFGVFAGEL